MWQQRCLSVAVVECSERCYCRGELCVVGGVIVVECKGRGEDNDR